MTNQEFPLDPQLPPDMLTYAQLASFRGSDFDLCEQIVGAIAEIPAGHKILSDPEIAKFVQSIAGAGNFIAKLPSTTIEDNGSVISRDAAPDLLEAQMKAANGVLEMLTIARSAANKLEAAGFQVYGRQLGW